MNLIDIMTPLAQPFAPQDIDFLPKSQFEKDGKTMCIGLPFADPRVYQDRLNEVCPGEWSSQATVIVAGAKLVSVVTVTVCGVPHTDVGEAPLTSENAATESFAQGFKRACAQTGLGRFLYALEKQYLPYDKQKKRFALTPQELLNAVKVMYRKAGLLSSASVPVPARETIDEPSDDSPATREQLTEIADLARAQRRRIGKAPATYGEAKTMLADLRAAS